MLSPKPPQLVCNLHQRKEGEMTIHIDGIRCRESQFLENLHDIPIFCALETPLERFRGSWGLSLHPPNEGPEESAQDAALLGPWLVLARRSGVDA